MADVSKKTTPNHSNLGAACYRCRGFRHACDRTKPACSRCKRRGITCQYPEAAPTLKKLQKATETLGDRIKKFGDLLKTSEVPNKSRGISLQRLAQPRSSVAPAELNPSTSSSPFNDDSSISIHSDVISDFVIDDGQSTTSNSTMKSSTVASTSSFSVYPCTKCYKDLQQCDLTLPSCSRCTENSFECVYTKTEPKANHVSQVLNTMNKVMDQWQDSIDKMAKDFAQKTRDFGQRVDQSFKKKPLQPFAWKITTTNKGLSVESNVNSFNDLSKLVDQFKKAMHITPRDEPKTKDEILVELDDTSSINTSSGFSLVWNTLSHPTQVSPDVDISQELTDSLVELYCRTPCCSGVRLPIIDTNDFLARYHDPEKRPSIVLIYAVCAVAARNAFQMHVWGKRQDSFNMGKSLSIAYCLKGRESLAECFDEPTIEHCQAAFLLSYCNLQNGYSSVNSIYEWIAFTMAQELGLYDEGRELNQNENMLVWCLYYFNTWYRVLQGFSNVSDESGKFHPKSPLIPPPLKPQMMELDDVEEPAPEMIQYYVYTEWYSLIQLQILRHEVMTRLVQAQTLGKQDTTLTADLLAMQDKLQAFYDSLPVEWKNPDLESMSRDQARASTPEYYNEHYHVDIHEFARSCILNVHVYYNINKILLNQAFFPADHMPTTPFSIQCLNTCVDAAYAITQTLDIMVKYPDECRIPILGFLFANMVYMKLLNYNQQYQEFAKICLEQSVNVCKMSKAYLYDFEMTQNLVGAMEQDVHKSLGFMDATMFTPTSIQTFF